MQFERMAESIARASVFSRPGRSKQTTLRIVRGRDGDFIPRLGRRRGQRDGRVVALPLGEDCLGAVDHAERQAGEAGELDSVAAASGVAENVSRLSGSNRQLDTRTAKPP